MQSLSDAQLLRDYAVQGAEAAFTELVHRHANLVYSAALRQVESPDLAADITQTVFISLARGAASLAPRLPTGASLAGWLCRSTRNLSLNHRRDEFRRQKRERQAMDHILATPDAAPDWDQLRRVLDDSMSDLDEADYDALVLRFYQNQDFRAVGAALGVSDDTAQKRVSRALDKLRGLLAQRSVRTTAAALAMVISANAVQAAPAGLAAAATAAALSGATVTTAAAAAATKAIAMTTLQKAIVTVTLAAAAGTAIYEARQAGQSHDRVETLLQQVATLAQQVQDLQRERDETTNHIARLLAQNPTSGSNPSDLEILRLRGEIGVLRRQNDELKASQSKAQTGTQVANETTALPPDYPSTPDAAVRSILEATRQGDWNSITNQFFIAGGLPWLEEAISRAGYNLQERTKGLQVVNIGQPTNSLGGQEYGLSPIPSGFMMEARKRFV